MVLDKGKGIEQEVSRQPKSPGMGKGKGLEREPSKERKWVGWYAASWYCECNRLAICRTTIDDKNGNRGRKGLWFCPRERDDQCRFFVWDDEVEEAKEWLEKNGRQQAPETPRKKGQRADEPRTPATNGLTNDDNPWTFSIPKKRKQVSREVSNGSENDDPFIIVRAPEEGDSSKQGGHADIYEDDTSRKAVRLARASTPGQTVNSRLQAIVTSLPTPETGHKPLCPPRQRSESPTPGPRLSRPIDLREEQRPDLTTTVLELISGDGVRIKGSTEAQIEHEIELELDQSEARLRRYRETVAGLRRRIDMLERRNQELENLVRHMGLGALNDPIELSD